MKQPRTKVRVQVVGGPVDGSYEAFEEDAAETPEFLVLRDHRRRRLHIYRRDFDREYLWRFSQSVKMPT